MKRKLTKKQVIVLTIITIILGILCYFISTEVTKSIIDHKTMKEKFEKDDFNDLREVDTIDNISLEDFINKYNEISDNDISINEIDNNQVMINNMEVNFSLSDNSINIVSINFKNKTKSFKELVTNMILANNDNINKKTIDLIIDKVFETLGTTSDERSETSEFFQYQGLEFSLKKYKDSNYKYSFRIGRITS